MTEVERIVSRAKRGRAVFVGVVALLCFGVTFAIVDIGQESRITNVERTTCAKDPAGKACQKTKRQSDRKRSIADTCIAFWKVDYPCPAPGSGARREFQAKSKEVPNLEFGQGTQPPDTGSGADLGTDEPTSAEPKTSPKSQQPHGQAESPPHSEGTPVDTPTAEAAPEAEPTRPSSPAAAEAKPGLIDNPGGVLGEATCGVGKATGLPVCSE